MNKTINLICFVGVIYLCVILVACGKKDAPSPTPPTAPQDSTKQDSTRAHFVDYRVDGVHDLAVDTAPHTNVMAIEIIPTTADTSLVTLDIEQLPKGVAALFSKSSGRGQFKTNLHFSYDYSGAVGTYPAAIVIRKGDSVKRVGFNVIVPDTPSQGWVFAGYKTANVIASYVYQPEYQRHLLGATDQNSPSGSGHSGLNSE